MTVEIYNTGRFEMPVTCEGVWMFDFLWRVQKMAVHIGFSPFKCDGEAERMEKDLSI